VFEKISLGCSLVQLYTSLVFRGPGFIIKILEELSEILKKKGIANIKDLIGTNEKI
jgi:dihydroorotate dehydrogenase